MGVDAVASELRAKGDAAPFRALTQLLQACCPGPVVHFLRTLGYEQVLVIRGCQHVALWLSCIISLTFTALWFSDVFTFRCASTKAASVNPAWFQCTFQGVGIFIFFAGFRDSVRMIAHFDTHKQEVLSRKRRALEALQIESAQVFQAAGNNVERLREKVVHMMKKHVAEYAMEVFTIIIPNLAKGMSGERDEALRQDDEVLYMQLLLQFRNNLVEVTDLADVMLQGVAQEHPEVFRRLGDAIAVDTSAAHALQLWDVWLRAEVPSLAPPEGKARPGKAAPRASISEAPGTAALERGELSRLAMAPRKTPQDRDRLTSALAEDVLHSIEELLRLPERLDGFKSAIPIPPAISVRRRRAGFGRPPWDGGCELCLPRMAMWACLCLPACCCSCVGRWVRLGTRYTPPKRLNILGMFWLQVHTKLQERLLQGLVCSVIYLAVYTVTIKFMVYDIEVQALCHPPTAGKKVEFLLQDCVMEIVRKCVGALTLLCYIPCLAICLYNIDNLDAVMETIETIWQLEDVQRAVRTFNQHMAEVAEQVVLLKAIEDRVLSRTSLVASFGRRVGVLAQPHTPGMPDQLRAAARQCVTCLQQITKELGTADTWMHLPMADREARVENIAHLTQDLLARNFQAPDGEDEGHAAGAASWQPSWRSGTEIELGSQERTSLLDAPDMRRGTYLHQDPATSKHFGRVGESANAQGASLAVGAGLVQQVVPLVAPSGALAAADCLAAIEPVPGETFTDAPSMDCSTFEEPRR